MIFVLFSVFYLLFLFLFVVVSFRDSVYFILILFVFISNIKMAPINVIPVGGAGGASGAGGSDGGARRRTVSSDNVFREDEL